MFPVTELQTFPSHTPYIEKNTQHLVFYFFFYQLQFLLLICNSVTLRDKIKKKPNKNKELGEHYISYISVKVCNQVCNFFKVCNRVSGFSDYG